MSFHRFLLANIIRVLSCKAKSWLIQELDDLLEHLDLELLNFLRSRFPDEVKTKQKENDHAVGVCLYGEGYDKCLMM